MNIIFLKMSIWPFNTIISIVYFRIKNFLQVHEEEKLVKKNIWQRPSTENNRLQEKEQALTTLVFPPSHPLLHFYSGQHRLCFIKIQMFIFYSMKHNNLNILWHNIPI